MSIIEKIRLLAALNKHSVALRMQGEAVNFDEFIKRIDGLALTLRELGCGSGCCVAIMLPRSFDMIIAMFGILAAGATFLPLDPVIPQSRLKIILDDAKPVVLLGLQEEELCKASNIVFLHPRNWAKTAQPFRPPASTSAYIIYTSGSTGVPKGVEISHQALENYLDWAVNTLPFTGAGVPLFTSIAFDHAVTNVFPPLLMGESIILLPSISGGKDLGRLLLGTENAPVNYSYIKIVPSMFEFLNSQERARIGKQTKLLMFGGEKLPPNLVQDARLINPNLEIMNHYGPTEATVGCCAFSVMAGAAALSIPIGKPIPGVLASVRTSDFRIAEAMEVGELFIGGIGLATGYLRNEALNEMAFVYLPENDSTATRWYRTGDLAMIRPDGNIECLGRIDDQVKILGNRIEPAEIVRHINLFPGVKQALVFAHKNQDTVELAAAVRFSNEQPAKEEFRRYLLSKLPPAMVPVKYLFLDEIPVSNNGKTDFQELSSLLAVKTGALSIEEEVKNKFCEILCCDNINEDDDFFLLGGDSLGTVEIAAWAEEAFKFPVELSSIFDFPTPALFSNYIRKLKSS